MLLLVQDVDPAVAFVTNYLLGITQLNPMEYPVPIHHWRFIEKSRPDLPDIDIDTAGNKRENVIAAVASILTLLVVR